MKISKDGTAAIFDPPLKWHYTPPPPMVCIPPELALRLHAALTNPTPWTACQVLQAELEKYLQVEE